MAQPSNTAGTEQEMNTKWSMDNSSIVQEQQRTDERAARDAPSPPFVGSTPEEGGDTTKDTNMAGKGTGPLGTDLDVGSGNRTKETSAATMGSPRADEGLNGNATLGSV